jgi:hypothetical protein
MRIYETVRSDEHRVKIHATMLLVSVVIMLALLVLLSLYMGYGEPTKEQLYTPPKGERVKLR